MLIAGCLRQSPTLLNEIENQIIIATDRGGYAGVRVCRDDVSAGTQEITVRIDHKLGFIPIRHRHTEEPLQ